MRKRPPALDAEEAGAAYHRQGSLDGLCGIYCIINALSLMLGQSAFNPHALFLDMLRSLSGSVVDACVNGLTTPKLVKLLRVADMHLKKSGHTLVFRKAYRCKPDHLAEYWSVLARHHRSFGNGSILVGMSGTYDHWTCIERVTKTSLVMADSGVLEEIDRRNITIGTATSYRTFVLAPTQTFLLDAA